MRKLILFFLLLLKVNHTYTYKICLICQDLHPQLYNFLNFPLIIYYKTEHILGLRVLKYICIYINNIFIYIDKFYYNHRKRRKMKHES